MTQPRSMPATPPSATPPSAAPQSIVDLLDKVVERGAVVNGDVIISLAGVDLIRLDLRLLLAGIDVSMPGAAIAGPRDGRAS